MPISNATVFIVMVTVPYVFFSSVKWSCRTCDSFSGRGRGKKSRTPQATNVITLRVFLRSGSCLSLSLFNFFSWCLQLHSKSTKTQKHENLQQSLASSSSEYTIFVFSWYLSVQSAAIFACSPSCCHISCMELHRYVWTRRFYESIKRSNKFNLSK